MLADSLEMLVCVGGAYDGRRVQIQPGLQWIQLPVYSTAPEEPEEVISLRREEYVRLDFHAGEVRVDILAPLDMPAGDVLHRLVQGYRREG